MVVCEELLLRLSDILMISCEVVFSNVPATSFVLGLSEIRQKTQRCRKNAYDGLENAYYL